MPSSSPPFWNRRGVRLTGRLMLELLVVFIGVYAASMLAQRHAIRAEQQHAFALREALATELGYIHSKGSELDMGDIPAYLLALQNGTRPALHPLSSRIPFSPDVWEAAMASGAVRLIEPDLLLELSAFYGEMRSFIAELEQNRAYNRAVLLPNLGAPDTEFYDEEGRLRPKYHWYIEHLHFLQRQAPHLAARAGELAAKLES